jgi:hypothetical protein
MVDPSPVGVPAIGDAPLLAILSGVLGFQYHQKPTDAERNGSSRCDPPTIPPHRHSLAGAQGWPI